jgi:hypothetical protein
MKPLMKMLKSFILTICVQSSRLQKYKKVPLVAGQLYIFYDIKTLLLENVKIFCSLRKYFNCACVTVILHT